MNLFKKNLKKYCKIQKFTQEEYKAYFFFIIEFGENLTDRDIEIYLNWGKTKWLIGLSLIFYSFCL